ncbi:MAG: metal-dependent transcriptional regulator [Bacteroidia bacterium]|nr:metal-dependent transcriptional regulator [Bacteroidia bacterium]MDW8302267.1 metal-dependent transcriptional regulator [Bacteroidia bacterium]
MLTVTEENYLKAIYKCQTTHTVATTTQLAELLNTTAASVTDMLKKLCEKNLVIYAKYQGACLSEEGKKIALQIIRKHRLWEVFLVEKLGYTWDTVHPIAEQLEHIQSDDLIDKLDKFLNYPQFDPHGDPIPNAQGKIVVQPQCPLSALKPKEKGSFTGVADHSPEFLRYLNKINLKLGDICEVYEVNEFDKSMLLKINSVKISLSEPTAKNILVCIIDKNE